MCGGDRYSHTDSIILRRLVMMITVNAQPHLSDRSDSQDSAPEESLGTACDRAMMQRCLELPAAPGAHCSNLVGSVIIQDGQIGGRVSSRSGSASWKFLLLGAADVGATVYVNLEPCNHYGRLPCSEALVAAGVKKVVVGMVDPDPRVSGV